MIFLKSISLSFQALKNFIKLHILSQYSTGRVSFFESINQKTPKLYLAKSHNVKEEHKLIAIFQVLKITSVLNLNCPTSHISLTWDF